MIGIIIILMASLSLPKPGRCKVNMSQISVARGENVHLNCSNGQNLSTQHIWWFNGDIILGGDFTPTDLEIKNVFGNSSNETSSSLHIEGFNSTNAGRYNCTIGTVILVTKYHLSLKETSLHLFYKGIQAPMTLVLNQSDVSHLQCHIDPMAVGEIYLWKVNGSQTTIGVHPANISFENGVSVVGSTITIEKTAGVQEISCFVGNASRSVNITVNQNIQPVPTEVPVVLDIFDTDYFQYASVGIGLILCLVFVTFVCKTIKAKLCLRGSSEYQDRVKMSGIDDGNYYMRETDEEISSFYGSLPELDNIVNSYEESSSGKFSRENICFNNDLPTSLILLYWTATLTHRRDKIQDVMVAYVEADAPVEAKRLWKNCSDSRLSISDHPNLLKAMGYCKCEGVLFVISDYSEMNTLDKYLASEYGNFDASGDEFTGYALDIIDGMEFLDSVECAHPSLCASRILVNHLGICKLYDFCPRKQALDFLEIYLKEDGGFEWRMAPEVISSGIYTDVCDVWAVGMTLWELFFGGHSKLHGILHLNEYEMQQQLDLIDKPPECPLEIFTTMQLCLSKRPPGRPTMNEVKNMARMNKAIGTQSTLYIKMKKRTTCQENEVLYVQDPTTQGFDEDDILYDSMF